MKINKDKKIILTILFVILFLILIAFNFLKTKSYEVEYDINGYKIVESYDKKRKKYNFTIKENNFLYSFISDSKYTKKRKLIKDIEEYETENEKCIKVISDKISYNYLCHNEEIELDYRITSPDMLNKLDYKKQEEDSYKYNNKEIFTTLDYTFLIWNYKGFDYINDSKQENIQITDNDQYEIPLTYIFDKYLIMADYNSKYNFNKLYIINLEKRKVEEIKFDYNISFDSSFLGSNDKSVFLLDKKNKIEYEIVPKRKKIRIIATSNKKGLILKENGMEHISMTKIINDDLTFYEEPYYIYELKDEKLYQKIGKASLLISKNKVKDIVYKKEDTVLYLVDDSLYLFNNKYGETKIMSNFEWNFNYKNLIYLYIP